MIRSVLISVILFLLLPFTVSAQAPQNYTIEAKVTKVLEEREISISDNKTQLYQKLELVDKTNRTLTIESGKDAMTNLPQYKVGDEVQVLVTNDLNGVETYYIADFIRRPSLVWLAAIFFATVLFIAKKKGLQAIIGMFLSFAVIFFYILPMLSRGADPVLISLSAALFLIPVTFFMTHGIHRKTYIAVIATFISLALTTLLAQIFIILSHLSGFSSEEANFLQAAKPDLINMQGLLLAGLIIGALGILDDITISQASVVEQLRKANKEMTYKELYTRAMSVGHDHIASVVNTLVLIYTGASLPLLLLFIDNPRPFSEVVNYEMIAEEIVRTLVSSTGIVLAVPITTLIAAWYFRKN